MCSTSVLTPMGKRCSVKKAAVKPAETSYIIQQEWGEYDGGEYGVQKQDRKYGVVLKGCFFGCIVESEESCRNKCKYQPHRL